MALGGRNRKLRDHIFNLKHEVERTDWQLDQALKAYPEVCNSFSRAIAVPQVAPLAGDQVFQDMISRGGSHSNLHSNTQNFFSTYLSICHLTPFLFCIPHKDTGAIENVSGGWVLVFASVPSIYILF